MEEQDMISYKEDTISADDLASRSSIRDIDLGADSI